MWLFPKNDGVFVCGRVVDRGLLDNCGVVYTREKKVLRVECELNEFWSIGRIGGCVAPATRQDAFGSRDGESGNAMTLLYSVCPSLSLPSLVPWALLNLTAYIDYWS
jgi:hypothetical protein